MACNFAEKGSWGNSTYVQLGSCKDPYVHDSETTINFLNRSIIYSSMCWTEQFNYAIFDATYTKN